ncbi:MAG: NAD-binding protein, partial [Chloroflexota bacterium]|nr:NAD-binding protein [Chloroflexota bacterium]
GGGVGVETALYLARRWESSPEVVDFFSHWPDFTPEDAEALRRKGHDVTLLGRNEKVGVGLGGGTRWVLVKELAKAGVNVLTSTEVVGIEPDAVLARKGDERVRCPADSVVLATSYRPDEEMLRSFQGLAPEVYSLGDAESVQHAYQGVGRALEVGLAI